MNPRNLSIADFSYSLPENRIATYPLEKRDRSKLLIYHKGNISEDIYSNINAHIPADALLIFNDTKVVEARLLFQKPTGGVIEVFCLEPHEQYSDITTAMLQKGKVYWNCLVGGASKWKHGQVLEKMISSGNQLVRLRAVYIEKKEGSFVIELSWSVPDISFAELLHLAGAIPLPPYIKRKVELSDSERYQTIYAQYEGSVAAPTAGLHFTEAIFKKLQEKNIQPGFVTLHVGAGTFKPVKSEKMEGHEMHAEFIDVSLRTIELIKSKLENYIIPVGTTSMRTIESLYWLGVKLLVNNGQLPVGTREIPEIGQWELYDDLPNDITAVDALQVLLNWMEKNKTDRLLTKTQIIIAPGYQPRIAKALITNFHQPQSTLLLLIAALIGDDWREVYDYALANDFRFLSYGDGCILFP